MGASRVGLSPDEGISLLRRSLGQQPSVRALVYNGLVDIFNLERFCLASLVVGRAGRLLFISPPTPTHTPLSLVPSPLALRFHILLHSFPKKALH